MEKTTFTRGQDNDLNLGVLFTKVDKKNRIVSGFATLDNVDDHGDEVSAKGSIAAFQRFRGGLREMHLPNAVGTLVSFEETKKYDPKTDRVYNGIYVHAKVSKGAADTWEKVLDGTLKGFSIGGKIKKKSRAVKDDGSEHGVIEDYDLIELSLVDNPANPLANVLTVQKIGDSYVYPDDDVVEKQVMNILLHEESQDVILSEDAERDGFVNIGWTDSPDNTAKIRAAIESYEPMTTDEPGPEPDPFAGFELSIDADGVPVLLNEQGEAILRGMDNTDKGGATVAKDIEKDAGVESDQGVVQSADTDEVEATDAVEEVETDDTDDTDEVEKAADVTEVEDATDSADEIVAKVLAAVEGALTKATDAAQESQTASSEAKSAFEKSLEDFNEQISSLKDAIKKDLDGLAKRVEDVESSSAVKKSADVVNDDDAGEDNEGDSFWRGSGFLSARDLVKG